MFFATRHRRAKVRRRMGSTGKEIGQRIRLARERKKLTIDQLADLIGFTGRSLGDWERGEAEPGAVAIRAIARELRVSSDYLLWLEGQADSLRLRDGTFYFVDRATFLAVKTAKGLDGLPFDERGNLLWAHVVPESWDLVDATEYGKLRAVIEGKKAEFRGKHRRPRT